MSGIVNLGDMYQKIKKQIEWRNICPKCGKETRGICDVPSFADDSMLSSSQLCEECRKEVDLQEQVNYLTLQEKQRIENCTVPQEFSIWDKRIGNNELARQIRDNSNNNLFIHGANNCGKSRALAFNLLLKTKMEGMRCKFIRFSDLAGAYAAICKRESENASSYIDGVLSFDILMIDDIGKRRITENAGEMLYDIFDRIYIGSAMTKIWISSNFSLLELAEHFMDPDMGDGVISRIDRMTEASKFKIIEVKK